METVGIKDAVVQFAMQKTNTEEGTCDEDAVYLAISFYMVLN